MNDKIMNIIDLVKMVEEMEYVDCKKDDYYDVTYESILFYLKFCQVLVLNAKEEKKIPKKIKVPEIDDIKNSRICHIEYKINEIIDYLDYLKSKGE